ncbi:hypothetical protein DLM_3688 [Aquitalea magnusonii]|uniref:Uncharacterized protein n=1 Tax=Aquitalea magnusonii TaxID=332411 RepID=A0A3G9GNC7_9NEIS|nr:hypothetical protein DLM_3688 [Aquitalea magnusonii]
MKYIPDQALRLVRHCYRQAAIGAIGHSSACLQWPNNCLTFAEGSVASWLCSGM